MKINLEIKMKFKNFIDFVKTNKGIYGILIIIYGMFIQYVVKYSFLGNCLIAIGILLIQMRKKELEKNLEERKKLDLDFLEVKERIKNGESGFLTYTDDYKNIIIKFDEKKIYSFNVKILNEKCQEINNLLNLQIEDEYEEKKEVDIEYLERLKYFRMIEDYCKNFDDLKCNLMYKFNVYRKLSLNLPNDFQSLQNNNNTETLYLTNIYLLRKDNVEIDKLEDCVNNLNDLEYFGVLVNRAILLQDSNQNYYIYYLDFNDFNDFNNFNDFNDCKENIKNPIKILYKNVHNFSVVDTAKGICFRKQLLPIQINQINQINKINQTNIKFDSFLEFLQTKKGIQKINHLFLQAHKIIDIDIDIDIDDKNENITLDYILEYNQMIKLKTKL